MTLWHPDKRISRWLSWIGQFDASADWVTRTVPGCPTKKSTYPVWLRLTASSRPASAAIRGSGPGYGDGRSAKMEILGRNSYEVCVRFGAVPKYVPLFTFFGRILRELFGLEMGRSLSYFVQNTDLHRCV